MGTFKAIVNPKICIIFPTVGVSNVSVGVGDIKNK